MRLSLLPELRARCRSDLHDMRDASGRGDLALVERAAHRMVGAAGALEMHEVSRWAREVYAAVRACDTEAVSAALDGLEAALDEWKDA
jgi:HPt (histidine-containing phosphotransfer) domain-containing protein